MPIFVVTFLLACKSPSGVTSADSDTEPVPVGNTKLLLDQCIRLYGEELVVNQSDPTLKPHLRCEKKFVRWDPNVAYAFKKYLKEVRSAKGFKPPITINCPPGFRTRKITFSSQPKSAVTWTCEPIDSASFEERIPAESVCASGSHYMEEFVERHFLPFLADKVDESSFLISHRIYVGRCIKD